MTTAIVSLEGINLPRGLVVREMSIFYPNDGSFRHYFFDPPDLDLNEDDRQTERFYRNVLGGTGIWEPIRGSLPYINLHYLLQKHSAYELFTVGNISQNFLIERLPLTRIINIQDVSVFIYPRVMEPAGCGVNHNPRYCSLAKLKVVREFCQAFFSDFPFSCA